MSQTDFDLIVIGGGSGGLAAARNASRNGARTLLIERSKLGGTCVNLGCIPKKIYWNAAETLNAMNLASGYGIELVRKPVNFKVLHDNMRSYIESLNDSYKHSLGKDNVSIAYGNGRFVSPNTVAVDNQIYTTDKVIIATGGKPIRPSIEGGEHVITSDEFFDLEELPKRTAIVGSGYIAVELAAVISAHTRNVDLILRGTHLLRQFDHDIGQVLRHQMASDGIRIHINSEPQRIKKTAHGLAINTAKGKLGPFDSIIWAAGRCANLDHLHLEKAGLKPNSNGFIESDEQANTAVENIFAIGDITGRAALTPLAIAAGRRLTNRLYCPEKAVPMTYDQIPTVVFSHPPIATLGVSEKEALEQYPGQVRIYRSHFTSMIQALSNKKSTSMFKLVTMGEEEKVIGCHLVGDRVDEIIQGFAVAMRIGALKKDFDRTIAIHPTIRKN